jgi:hypothetical protein
MNSEAEAQIDEWKNSYRDILAILQKHGKNDAFGEGDLWLLDDNLGGGLHKIYIFNISVVTRELVRKLMELLGERYLGWHIMMILDLKSPTNEEIPPEGLIVYGSFIEEFWDKGRLARLFGERFLWGEDTPPASDVVLG